MKALPLLNDEDRHAFVGMTGTGKSYAAKKHVEEYLKKNPEARCLVIDPENEWSQKGKLTRQVSYLGPCRERVTHDQLIDAPEVLDEAGSSVAVIVSSDEDEAAEQVAEIVDLVQSTGNILVVPEEVGLYAAPDVGNNAAKKALSALAKRGRHWGCPVVFCAQRMVDIPLGARSQLSGLQVFQQQWPADLNALEELTRARGGFLDGDAIDADDLVREVAQLKKRRFAVWTARAPE